MSNNFMLCACGHTHRIDGYGVAFQSCEDPSCRCTSPMTPSGSIRHVHHLHRNPGTYAVDAAVERPTEDAAIRPAYYRTGGLEVADAVEAWGLDKDAYLFTALKYIVRAGKKEGEDEVRDLRKAKWYLERAIGLRTKGTSK